MSTKVEHLDVAQLFALAVAQLLSDRAYITRRRKEARS